MNEMNLAQTMRETADKANNDRELASKSHAEQWVDANTIPCIKRAAENGEYYTSLRIPNNIHYGYAVAHLGNMHFTIEKMRDRYIRVSW